MIEENQMLMNLPHVADMRHNRQLELLGHQTNCKKLADACKARAICLDKVNTAIKEIVLEYKPVWDVFAGGNATGAMARAISRCAWMSSGCVGSSIQSGRNEASVRHLRIASGTFHCWLA